MPRFFLTLLLIIASAASSFAASEPSTKVRELLCSAILADGAEQAQKIAELADYGDPLIAEVLTAWKQEGLFVQVMPDGSKVTFIRKDGQASRLDTGAPFPEGTETKPLDTNSKLRKAIKGTLDLLALASPDAATRAAAVNKLGMEQRLENLPILEKRLSLEKDPVVRKAVMEARSITLLKSPDASVRATAATDLGKMQSIGSLELLVKLSADPESSVRSAAATAVSAINQHLSNVNLLGTIFRGFSLGSVLLVVALGLAITLGLMGVINMAHGEMMAVGAYTTYIVHGLFGSGLFIPCFGLGLRAGGAKLAGTWFDTYFLVAIPASFISAALMGMLLERWVIRYLYKRPLESLLATWGVSLILQQAFRQIFGSNNVQVYSPSWLSGNFTVNDIIFGWNRIFVIAFAIAIVIGTYLLLTKTPVGLLIRAVTQNREMAASMGVRTERVNMLTFAFGSGLAGIAGAFLSQIGNVGPSLGQTYIVDAFMTVVAGGVGNIMGTVISSLGIGVADQTLQQILLNPVLGKIIVLCAIIVFLQWKPGGLFPTRSRSLEG